MKTTNWLALTLLCWHLGSTPAWAHPDHGTSPGWTVGLLHPLHGLDHLLALVGVGLICSHGGRRQSGLLAGGLLAALVVGGGVGLAGTQWSLLESALALTLILIGLAQLVGPKVLDCGWSVGILGIGLVHGWAHGMEMPTAVNAVGFFAGMLLTSAALFAAGCLLGHALQRQLRSPMWLRVSGLALTCIGLVMLAVV